MDRDYKTKMQYKRKIIPEHTLLQLSSLIENFTYDKHVNSFTCWMIKTTMSDSIRLPTTITDQQLRSYETYAKKLFLTGTTFYLVYQHHSMLSSQWGTARKKAFWAQHYRPILCTNWDWTELYIVNKDKHELDTHVVQTEKLTDMWLMYVDKHVSIRRLFDTNVVVRSTKVLLNCFVLLTPRHNVVVKLEPLTNTQQQHRRK